MLEVFGDTTPLIQVALFVLFTGGVGYLIKYVMDSRHTNAEIGESLRDELRGEINELRGQVEELRENFVAERRARISAQFAAWALRKKLDLVVQMLNEVRREQDMSELEMGDIPGFGVPTTEELRREMESLDVDQDFEDDAPRSPPV